VPLVATALFVAQQAGIEAHDNRWIGFVLLCLAGVPTTFFLLSAGLGYPWGQLERHWDGLEGWQRVVSSTVALVCGLATGAALVLITLSVVELDAEATEARPEPARVEP
jgi:hypothetical protein